MITLPLRFDLRPFAAALVLALSGTAFAHGDVTPQAVDTRELPQLGEQWRTENPYRSNAVAVRIGSSAYNQNCARCHGLEAVSGGIAPDLRKLDSDCATLRDDRRKAACVKEMDDFFLGKVRRGVTRNGAVYMPPFEGILSQEAMWSIKSYLETRREKPI
ncbi:cytochrome c-550 PedF [Calidifontimicrobium sp. SYSU G02091]|uniref:cytochrome c-550 PedF n=1 Tax=Calidifontimicrobium sp. SYSU G02091 TaxID=2926421 RepID=UPI001F52CE9A|nr:cytochrome c-550 PedF [Calidifontimicrobium sp. SYSU G02091]MCI1192638.1 cytochrome c-550 PedF [Calidifontimicrobium sp. SYSU G02091]